MHIENNRHKQDPFSSKCSHIISVTGKVIIFVRTDNDNEQLNSKVPKLFIAYSFEN